MEFGLLGPLRVTSGTGDVISLGGPRQRTVMAHLLLGANRELTQDQIIDRVWGDDPPASARGSLQAYVSRLRSAVGQDRLLGRSGAYVLKASPDEVDALLFDALRAESRLLALTDPEAASRVLRRALDLWRGSALSDLADEPSLAAAIARLTDAHLSASEEWVELELSLGRSAHVVAHLEELLAEQPYREPLWCQLVLALYRSGRQTDALDAYARARHVLADELGLDPGPDLRRLHDQVVRQDPALDLLGRPLRGYRLLEPVGSGASGTVHRALQPETGREVAIKVIRAEQANAPDFVRRFDAEAQIAARLEHPHVVPLHDYWREPDGAYLVMRLLRGGNLDTVLADGPLPPERVVRLVEQVAHALAFAHREGVVHRDVKPANILFDEEGNAYLSDFGIARDVESAGGEWSSTPAGYVSPEASLGGPVDARSDIYSLGMVALEALTLGRAGGGLPDAVERTIARATAPEPDRRPQQVLELAAELRLAVASSAPALEQAPDGVLARNPYKGLRSFSGADSDDFHGHDRLVDELVERLRRNGSDGRFVAVVGPSGSGKSSVVAAGLLPALRSGAVPGSEAWFVAEMHPGRRPYDELAVAMAAVAASSAPGWAHDVRSGASLGDAVAALLPDPAAHLLLVVDQFEELFTLTDASERDSFLATIAEAAVHPEGRIRVVVTLRADFYDQPLAHPGIAELVSAGTVAVRPLSPDELERAIAAPAESVGVPVESALTAVLVAHVSHQPASLPLLQYALTELFDQRQEDVLRLTAYEQMGGVSVALARQADRLYEHLDAAAQWAARQLFLRLVTLGDEGAVATRRRVARVELAHLDDVSPDAMDAAVRAFGDRRLLTFDRDPLTRGPTVEVAHEALLREWTLVRDWIDDAREDVVLHGRLAAAVREWREAGRDPSALLRGEHLRRYEAWAATSAVALDRDELEFLAVAASRRDAERLAEEERAADDALRDRRSLSRLRLALGVVAVFAVVASALTVVALDRGRATEEQSRASRARELAAASLASLDLDPELSTLLALEAVATTRVEDGTVLREAEEALHRSVAASRVVRSLPQGGGGLALVADGRRVVTSGGGAAGDVPTVWDLATGEAAIRIETARHAEYVAASPDGRLLALSGGRESVVLIDARTGAQIINLTVLGGAEQLAFGPGGTVLAAVVGRTVRRWRRDGDDWLELPLLSTSAQPVLDSVVISPDGTQVVAGAGDGWVHVWDMESGQLLDRTRAHEWPVMAVAYSPDGRWLASAGYDARVVIRDVRTWKVRNIISTGIPLEDVAFSADGKDVLTAGTDSVATTWRARTGQLLLRLVGHGGGILTDAEFVPDGRRVLTTGADGTTRLWDISARGARDWLTVPGVRQIYAGVTFSPDGSTFAAPAHPTGVTLWSSTTGEEVMTLGGTTEKLTTIAFSPDGTKLAAGSDAVKDPPVWDLRTGELIRLVGHTSFVRAVTFTPDSERVVTGGNEDGTIRVWDATTGEPTGVQVRAVNRTVGALAFAPDGRLVSGEWNSLTVRDGDTLGLVGVLPGHENLISGLAFSGDTVVTASFDGTARVWDLGARRETLVFRGHRGPVNQAAVSPDGTVVATTGEDGSTRLWELASGRERLVLAGHSSLVFGASFSPDGRLLATASPDGTVALHLLPVDELVELARGRLTRDLTEEECAKYLLESCA